jgi:hypothetical protein
MNKTRTRIFVFTAGAIAIAFTVPTFFSEAALKPAEIASAAPAPALNSGADTTVQVGTPNDDEGNPMPPIPVRAASGTASVAQSETPREIEVVGPLNDDEGNPMPPAPPRIAQLAAAPAR